MKSNYLMLNFPVLERAVEHPAQPATDVPLRDGHAEHGVVASGAGGQASLGQGRPEPCRRAPGGLGQGAALQSDSMWTHPGQFHVWP